MYTHQSEVSGDTEEDGCTRRRSSQKLRVHLTGGKEVRFETGGGLGSKWAVVPYKKKKTSYRYTISSSSLVLTAHEGP